MRNWVRGSFILIWLLYAMTVICEPPPNIYLGQTDRGYSVVRPPWIPKQNEKTLHVTVDKYITLYECLTQDFVPTKDLVIEIVHAPQIVDNNRVLDGLFVGYTFPNYSRKIFLVWRRTDMGQLASINPLYTFLHELIHDRQFRHKERISHDFTDAEKLWSGSDIYSRNIVFGDN